jgi:O-antigen ligase
MVMNLQVADKFSQLCLIALGFSLPLSKPLNNLLLALLLLTWLLGGNYRKKLQQIKSNQVILAAIALFAALLIGVLNPLSGWAEAKHELGKYIQLLLIPAMAYFFVDEKTRTRALTAFAISMVITLVASYLLAFGLINPLTKFGTLQSPTPFRDSIEHNVLMAFAIVFAAIRLRFCQSRSGKIIYAAFIVLAFINVLFMVTGRTGLVILLVAAIYFLFRWRGIYGLLVAAVVTISLLAAIQLFPSKLNDRLNLAITEYRNWTPNIASLQGSSIGMRLEFYYNSLNIISKHPLMGVGTGGVETAYQQQIEGKNMGNFHDPHNQYLYLSMQLGIAGLLLLIMLFYQQWKTANRFDDVVKKYSAHGLVITLAVSCLFNSSLTSHIESTLFAFMTALLFSSARPELGNPMR